MEWCHGGARRRPGRRAGHDRRRHGLQQGPGRGQVRLSGEDPVGQQLTQGPRDLGVGAHRVDVGQEPVAVQHLAIDDAGDGAEHQQRDSKCAEDPADHAHPASLAASGVGAPTCARAYWSTDRARPRLARRMGLTMSDAVDLAAVYKDLHANPELGFHETRTAALVAAQLSASGFEVTTGIGGTGVVGLLRNGEGPLVLLRADMDALPVEEKTGLPYASVARAVTDSGVDAPVMHACGHDVHVTCLLGACAALSADSSSWSGTLFAVFQPAEELGAGAQAMIDDGLFERFGRPDVVLGQHVAPLPAGIIGLRHGAAFAAADSLSIVLHGRGGHGSRPEASVDPVVMAAATVMRLQTIVSRELAAPTQRS